ncbi:hypothetical protein [Paenibacillus brevis]|nr:hypothetical protein [Paenibacillus brevis]
MEAIVTTAVADAFCWLAPYPRKSIIAGRVRFVSNELIFSK